MSTKPVVLVLGGDAFATRVAEIARDAGNIVALAAPGVAKIDKVRTINLDPSSHESITAAFQTTLEAYGRINAVLSAFVPQPTSKDAVPGADQTALRTGLDPSVRVAKIALFYARRLEGDKSVAWLAYAGDASDIMARTSAGCIVGTYRSLVARFSAQDTWTSLVYSETADDVTARALVGCINPAGIAVDDSIPARFKTATFVVENGNVVPTSAIQGVPQVFQYRHVFHRLAGLVMFNEDVTRWKLNGGPKRALFKMGVAVAVTVLAFRLGLVNKLSYFFR